MQFLKRQFFTEPDFDASQGKCCFMFINRKGARIIMYWDVIFFVNIIRWPFALRALLNHKAFNQYAKVRRITFWVQTILSFLGIFAFVIYDVLLQSGTNFMMIVVLLAVAIVVCLIDYHWSHVITFLMRHPDTKPIDFLGDDDEPRYAYQMDPNA